MFCAVAWWSRCHEGPSCRRCRYPMETSGELRCPECGWKTSSELDLYRTRPKKWPVFLGLASLAIGAFLFCGSRNAGDWWWQSIPDSLLVALSSNGNVECWIEIESRLEKGELAESRLPRLVEAARGVLRRSSSSQCGKKAVDVIILLTHKGIAGSSNALGATISNEDEHIAFYAITQVKRSGGSIVEAVESYLVDAMVSGSCFLVSSEAAVALSEVPDRRRVCLASSFARALASPFPLVRTISCVELRDLGNDAQGAVPILQELVTHPDGHVRRNATHLLSEIALGAASNGH
jgi:hypothetical protein